MTTKLKLRNDLAFFALGGLGEVGKNMYCIEYKNQIFVIDSGILFPDEHLLGVDYVIPDFSYLIENQEKIVGLFITHGHEDHIGGIPFLLKQVNIPTIYASGLAVDLIKLKLQEHKNIKKPKIIAYNSNSVFKFSNVELSFIRVNHSIPDAYAFVFRTPLGIIMHTGDFKIDFTPVGPKAEFDKIAALGAEGVLCLFEDSTNALRPGFTDSELKIGESIKDLFEKINGRAIVATFASNMHRIQQIIEASIKYNRKVAIFGRSMLKTVEVGLKIGYIKAPEGTFVDAKKINDFKANKITILCTGSQGEPLAALSRIANGSHRQIKLHKGDTVIFSSSPIPGNQEGINRTINQLFKGGANVITHSPLTDTHTTGHASQGELKLMISLVKPKFFAPIHGEYRMQRVHANLAISCGIPEENCFILKNGDVLTLHKNKNKHTAIISNSVKSGAVFVDGGAIGDTNMELINERRSLSDDGLFSIIFTIDKKTSSIMSDPQVVSRGFIYMKDSQDLTKHLAKLSTNYLTKLLKADKSLNLLKLKKQLSIFLSNLIYQQTDRKPMVLPIFMVIE